MYQFNLPRDINTSRINRIEDAGISIKNLQDNMIALSDEFNRVIDQLSSSLVFASTPLSSFRKMSSMGVPNLAAHGGVLASDSTPALEPINGATNGCQRIKWIAGNTNQIGVTIPLDPDLSREFDIKIYFRIASSGITNAVGFTIAAWFGSSDTALSFTSTTNQTTSYLDVEISIPSSDIERDSRTLSLGLTPVTHATDALYLIGFRMIGIRARSLT